jgi:hypothetical protein
MVVARLTENVSRLRSAAKRVGCTQGWAALDDSSIPFGRACLCSWQDLSQMTDSLCC